MRKFHSSKLSSTTCPRWVACPTVGSSHQVWKRAFRGTGSWHSERRRPSSTKNMYFKWLNRWADVDPYRIYPRPLLLRPWIYLGIDNRYLNFHETGIWFQCWSKIFLTVMFAIASEYFDNEKMSKNLCSQWNLTFLAFY